LRHGVDHIDDPAPLRREEGRRFQAHGERFTSVSADCPLPSAALYRGPMLLKIVEVGDPVLRAVARPLAPEEVRAPSMGALIELMRETMRDAPGVGLAAPQIGESLQLAVIEDRNEYDDALGEPGLPARGRPAVPFQAFANPR